MLAQRNPRSPHIISARPLTREDLQYLREPSARARIQNLKEAHHLLARLIAGGASKAEAAKEAGYTYVRVCVLCKDPAFEELISRYRGEETNAWRKTRDAYYETISANALKAEQMVSDKLDEAIDSGETLPIRDLIAISRDAADRTGYHKRTASINVNLDFAAKLEKAISRSKTISHVA